MMARGHRSKLRNSCRMNTGPSSRHQRTFRAGVDSARAARVFVAEQLHQNGAPPATLADLQLVVSELVANAVQHGASDVVVQVDSADDAWLQLTVVGGTGLPADLADPARWRIADPNDAAGRGLGIVRALVDEVVVDTIDEQLVVRCRRHRDARGV